MQKDKDEPESDPNPNPNTNANALYEEFVMPDVASSFPFSTFMMVVILCAIKYEDVINHLDEYAHDYKISREMVITLLSLIVGIVALAVWAFYTGYLYWNFLGRKKEARNKILEKEKHALIAIYNTTNGKGWDKNSNWCGAKEIFTWKGVHTYTSGRVKKLILGNNNLVGPLPIEIGDLEVMMELDVRGNKLSGPLPASLVKLTRMEGLYMFDNYFEGIIPAEALLKAFSKLRGIYLFSNKFENNKEAEKVFKEHYAEGECIIYI